MKRLVLVAIGLSLAFTPGFGQYKKIIRLTKKGEFEKVMKFADDRLASISERKINEQKLKQIHIALAKVDFLLGDFVRAEREFGLALAMVNKKAAAGRKLRLADFDVMDEAAHFYVSTGNFRQAKKLISRSLTGRVRKLHKRDPTNYRPYLPLGLLHFYNNRLDSARYFLDIYQKQIRNSNYTGFLDINKYADTYQVLADIDLHNRDWKNAKKMARKSARLQRHPWTKRQVGKNYFARIRALNTVSIAYYYTGKSRKANAYNRKAIALYHRKYRSEAFVLVPLYLQRARLAGTYDQVDTCLANVEKVFQLQRDFIRNSFNHLSEYEKENLSARLNEGFHSACEIVLDLSERGKITEAHPIWGTVLNYVLQSKGLILRESNRLIEQMRTSDDPEVRLSFERWKAWKNELAFISARAKTKPKYLTYADALQNKIVELEKTLNIDSISADDTFDWRDVAKTLRPEESAIEMLRVPGQSTGRTSYLAFILDGNDKLQVVRINDGDDLDHRVIRYYFNAAMHEVDDTVSFNRFWKPIEHHTRASKKIYVSADGVYHLLNIATLKDPRSQKFIGDETSIVNVTGLKNLVITKPTNFLFSSAALFGSPDFSTLPDSTLRTVSDGERLPPLPATLVEVEQIRTLLENRNIPSTVFTRKKASEHALVTLPSSNVLHVATHGFFSTQEFARDPMLASGLILSIDTARFTDGLLTAYEASALNLEQTNLVVLSACKTGLGEIRESEGVYGLQRAFEVAGVDFLLMTLWNVDDAVTKEFMVDFYQRLLNEKNVLRAFETSQLQLKKKHPQVYYWGAYKLISSF